jgi:HAD superfamily hydrolase (TIGR01459 family)
VPGPSASRFLSASAPYRIVFTDQYGVLHDGHKPYPGAQEALRALKARGALVLVLSNSGRSGEVNAGRLARFGFGADLVDHVVTSGDVARRFLQAGGLPVPSGAATRCLSITTGPDSDLADSLGYTHAKDGSEADLVLIGGSRGEAVGLDGYRTMLAPAARRGAPAVCTNPDRIMLTGTGTTFGSGRIAELYQELGGMVTWIGKPYREIYEAAAEVAGVSNPSEVLCVGDSVEHDVVGARGFGAAVVLVRTGILATLDERALAGELAHHGVVPDYVLPGLA